MIRVSRGIRPVLVLCLAGLAVLILTGPSGPVFPGPAVGATPAIDTQYQEAFQRSYLGAAAGNYDEAIRPLAALFKQGRYRNDYLVCLRLGWLYYRKGENLQSIQYYNLAAKLQPGAIEPWVGLLLPLVGAGRYEQAVTVGQHVLSRDRLNYSALARVARSYYMLKRYDRAADYYARLVEAYPGDVEMRAGLAWSYLRSGQKAKAVIQFRQVLAVYPSYFAQLGYREAMK